jgi:RimJ/RimL family protein N-acetyltransferase
MILRPFVASDGGRLLKWIDSPDALLQWAGPLFHWPLDRKQLEDYARTASDKRLIFTALDETGAAVGHAELNLERAHGLGQVSRVLVSPTSRGRGVCAAMMSALVHMGFAELGLHRLQLYVYDFNAAAIACYERFGFRREGHLRETTTASDGYWSSFVMGVLETESPPTITGTEASSCADNAASRRGQQGGQNAS